MTTRQAQIKELIQAFGQESTEDMLLGMGWANTYGQARAMITKALKAN